MDWLGFCLVLTLAVTLTLIYYYLSTREMRLRRSWKLIAEGEYVKVVGQTSSFNIYLGIAGQRSSPLPITVYTIFFKNNESVKVVGIQNFPPVGTYIRVYKNPLPEFKIEILESPHCL